MHVYLAVVMDVEISDAAAGGQVFMCHNTFEAVKDQCQELGRVTHENPRLIKPVPWTWGLK
jgi:NAD-dependent DNA ligase